MDTLEFLRRVLPSGGIYCSSVITDRGNRQRFHDDIEALGDALLRADERGQNTYFAVSTFKDGTSRKKVNAAYTRSLFIDVDCGPSKPFPTWKEGLRALGKFLKDAALPPPMVVRSGNGLHVYWVTDEDLTPWVWEDLAHSLKRAAAQHAFRVDANSIANLSMVLRPIGTSNYKDPKNPKAVEVLIDRPAVTVAEMRAALKPFAGALQERVKARGAGLLDSIAARSEFPPAAADLIRRSCAQVQWAVENQSQVTEPMWYALLGVAAYCEEPDQTALAWSEKHPGYSETATLAKLNQWRNGATGPATCTKFEAERPEGCKGCIYAGRIGTPVKLGVRYRKVSTADTAPGEAVKIDPPKPFRRTEAGIVLTLDGVDIVAAPFDIYPVSYGYDEALGYEVAQFLWDRPHVGWRPLTLRNAHLADGTYREFVSSIADQGIVLGTKKQTEWFQIMTREYMAELKKLRAMTNMYSTMGWKEDNTAFVLGDDIYQRKADGTVEHNIVRLASNMQRTGNEMFRTKGSADVWRAATTILRKAGLVQHQFSIGLGLASLLMNFTGLKGVTVSFFGPSGSGKSQAQLVQQSLFGDPEKLHFQSKYTSNALYTRFATYANLPVTVDEATQMSDSDVGDLLYSVSQGRDKARLDRSANERAAREWALIATMSTNKPLTNKLTSAGFETDAQMARLVELKVDRSPLFSDSADFGRKMHKLFTQNYGWAGREFIRRLLELGEPAIHAMIAEATTRFEERYGVRFTGVERYWEQLLVLVDLVLTLAYEWEITDYTPDKSVAWAAGQVPAMRGTIEENHRDGFDLLSDFLNEHNGDTIEVFYSPGQSPYHNQMRKTNGAVRVRLEAIRAARSTKIVDGTVYIDRAYLRRWFSSKGGDYAALAAQLTEDGAMMAAKRISMGKDTDIRLPQTHVVGIRMTHPRLEGLLDDINQSSAAASNVVPLNKSQGSP